MSCSSENCRTPHYLKHDVFPIDFLFGSVSYADDGGDVAEYFAMCCGDCFYEMGFAGDSKLLW